MEGWIIAKLIKPNDRSLINSELRLIGPEGEQIGVVKYDDARKMTITAGLDLVLVSDKTVPYVCRIMDFGKLRYEQKKKQKDQKRHQSAQKLKEIKFHVSIDPHDYGYKINHGIEFLGKGCKLKITLMFRGRETAHKDMGFDLIKKIVEDLKEHGVIENDPKLIGRNIIVSFAPKGHHH